MSFPAFSFDRTLRSLKLGHCIATANSLLIGFLLTSIVMQWLNTVRLDISLHDLASFWPMKCKEGAQIQFFIKLLQDVRYETQQPSAD
jgi:hypothetical protein